MGLNLGGAGEFLFGKRRGKLFPSPRKKVWNAPACNFIPDSDGWDYYYEAGECYIHVTTVGGNEQLMAPFFFPDGVQLLKAIAHGNGAGTWFIYRGTVSTGVGSLLCSAAVNTAVDGKDIVNPIIDNSKYAYWMGIEIENGKRVYGAKIEYR